MYRESDRHSPREDDELKAEMRGMLQGNGPSRAEEWRDPEPPADDDPDVPPFINPAGPATRSDEADELATGLD